LTQELNRIYAPGESQFPKSLSTSSWLEECLEILGIDFSKSSRKRVRTGWRDLETERHP
jgi:hypothetical protein